MHTVHCASTSLLYLFQRLFNAKQKRCPQNWLLSKSLSLITALFAVQLSLSCSCGAFLIKVSSWMDALLTRTSVSLLGYRARDQAHGRREREKRDKREKSASEWEEATAACEPASKVIFHPLPSELPFPKSPTPSYPSLFFSLLLSSLLYSLFSWSLTISLWLSLSPSPFLILCLSFCFYISLLGIRFASQFHILIFSSSLICFLYLLN